MGMRGIAAAVLLALAASPAGRADDPPPKVIADFDEESIGAGVDGYRGTFRRVAPPAGGGSPFLEWTIPGGGDSSALYLVPGDLDLTPYRSLRLRARLTGERPGSLIVRLENSRDEYLQGRVRGVGAQWKTFEIPFSGMDSTEKFDPKRVAGAAFVVFRPAAGGYELDDVVLVPTGAPPAPAAARPPSPAGGPKQPVVAAAQDFEGPESMDFVEAYESTCTRVPGDAPGGSWALRWRLSGAARECYIVLDGFPEDIRDIRTVRFRVRAECPAPPKVEFRIMSTIEDCLDGEIGDLGKAWRTVEIRLPEMQEMGRFDPRRVQEIGFVTFEPKDGTIFVDDIQLVAEPGGWRRSEKEEMAAAFGGDRARKVQKIATTHFDLFTDAAAAASKFPRGLENAYDFVRKSLGVGEMEEKLPVYIFQNPTLYVDFCVRAAGWTKQQAEQTAGHGSGRYFATYYQAPETPTVVHELTHSIFHRTEGPWGGSWFQEGVAVFVEHLWQKHTAAEIFAPRLRSGQFMPLRKFTSLPILVAENDVRGGAGTADALYLQAGAFYEFLLRGPMAAKWPTVQHDLATVVRKDSATGPALERGLGATLEEIEKAWVAWGSDPPKGK